MKFKFFRKILAFSVIFSAVVSTSTSNALKFDDMQGYAWAEKFVEDTSEKDLSQDILMEHLDQVLL